MPELPEVESIRLQLNKYLKGHSIKKIEINNKRLFKGEADSLFGAKFKNARRFGKVISVDFDNDYSFLAHVKLTGQFIYRGPNLKKPPILSKKVIGGIPGKHTHIIFYLDKEGRLFYNDVRQFGWIKVLKTADVEKDDFVKKLGPEPLDGLTREKFKEILAKTKRAIKVVLMDQEKIGGVGNIYANDALFKSKIAPTRPANSLKSGEVKSLYNSIEFVLKEGLKFGGASELAFVTPDGKEGEYQTHTLVYGKEGTICGSCKEEKIKKIFLSGRGTYFCPQCQKINA